MGIAELKVSSRQIILHAHIYLYGNAADEALAFAVANNINAHWNEPEGNVFIGNDEYKIRFNIHGIYAAELRPQDVYENDNALNNYFRIEEYADSNISFVDGINSNTGYFKLDNLLNNSTTAAHEFGHTIGLEHPQMLDIRGKGVPGIMYPRGTVTDPQFQYDPAANALEPGGTMNPFYRKVLPQDINNLGFHKLRFNQNGLAMLGDFSSVWHEAHAI